MSPAKWPTIACIVHRYTARIAVDLEEGTNGIWPKSLKFPNDKVLLSEQGKSLQKWLNYSIKKGKLWYTEGKENVRLTENIILRDEQSEALKIQSSGKYKNTAKN